MELVGVSPRATLEEAIQLMAEKRARHLPVVVDNEIIGIVAATDITKSMVTDREARIGDLTYYITHG
jgi:CBS domain-containing protein